MALLQVRQAASALGVHENTLRRWADRGLISAVRLPSGVRRFREEDITAMRSKMFEGLAPIDSSADDVVKLKRRPGGRSVD